MIRFLFLLLSFQFTLVSYSQVSLKDSSVFLTELKVSGTAQLPEGDLVNRFGMNANIGVQVNFKTKKNFVFGVEGSFLFGNRLKETSILDPLRNSNGNIIDINGEPAIVLTMERGFTCTAVVGYLWNIVGPNPNSGFLFKAGAGFMQHKIRIEADRNPLPQLEGEYLKGYDRLTNGFTLQQFAGYKYLSNKRLINFYGGFEIYEGFTQNRRSFNFDEVREDDGQRLDILYGFKFGWIIPLYQRAPKEVYY